MCISAAGAPPCFSHLRTAGPPTRSQSTPPCQSVSPNPFSYSLPFPKDSTRHLPPCHLHPTRSIQPLYTPSPSPFPPFLLPRLPHGTGCDHLGSLFESAQERILDLTSMQFTMYGGPDSLISTSAACSSTATHPTPPTPTAATMGATPSLALTPMPRSSWSTVAGSPSLPCRWVAQTEAQNGAGHACTQELEDASLVRETGGKGQGRAGIKCPRCTRPRK